jgi:hypothetical protein
MLFISDYRPRDITINVGYTRNGSLKIQIAGPLEICQPSSRFHSLLSIQRREIRKLLYKFLKLGTKCVNVPNGVRNHSKAPEKKYIRGIFVGFHVISGDSAELESITARQRKHGYSLYMFGTRIWKYELKPKWNK